MNTECARGNLSRLVKAVLVGWLLVCSARADWVATGQFNYTDRLYDLNGFTGTTARPVREADVQIYDTSTMVVLASGATNSTGNFSINVTDAQTRNVGVRVLSSNVQIASLNFAVVDDANADAVYSYHDAATDQVAHAPAVAVNFGTMTMPVSIGAIATTDWSSQVFNSYDMGVLLADWIASADGVRPAVFYTILWNPNNGRTGSFYSGSTNRLSLSDDDAYDDPNILHEIGHYIEDEYGRSRNTGGTHFIGDNDQDPRLAYSEGFATFVSAAVLDFGGRDRPDIYQDRDSFASGTGGGFSYSFESATVGGATNEQATTAALYDLIDTSATLDANPGTDDDSIGGQQAAVWSVVEQMRVLNLPATSLEDFWDIWFSLGLGSAREVAAAFASHNVDFAPDAQEPNNTPATSTLLTVGAAYQRNSFYRTGPQAGGDEDWFRFTATAGTYYSIEVNGAANSIFGRPDPEIWLFDSGLTAVLAYNDDPYDSSLNTQSSGTAQDMGETAPVILWQAPANGTYYVYLRHASQERALLGRYGTYHVRVRSLAVPAPTISSVSEQRMLPGQSYQALVVGANFSRGALITTNAPGVTVSAVHWIAPTALIATLTPAVGVANGSYSLSVTNPGGTAATLASAFEVNSAAAPPVMMTEVGLSTGLVEVKNLGTAPATLTGWTIQGLQPGTSTQTFTFPTFTLAAGATVVVHEASGTNTANDLFDLTNSFNWAFNNGSPGDVSLVDDGGRNVDFLRMVTSPTSTHSAPIGTGGAWMPPQYQAPATGFSLARSEATALYRTPSGLSSATPTMPASATGRANNVDPWEDNDQPRRAPILGQVGSISGLRISARPTGLDSDWFGFVVEPGDTLILNTSFSHAAGNLDMELYAPGEESVPLLSSTSADDDETIALTSAQSTTTGGGLYRLRVFGVANAVNTYTLVTATQATAEMVVMQGNSLNDAAGVVNFGTLNLGGSAPLIFTITNFGGTNLTLGAISKDGANSGDFAVNTSGMLTTLTPGSSTTFSVTFSPTQGGTSNAAIHIANSDADENPFDIALTGTCLVPDIVVEQPQGTSLTDNAGALNFGSVFSGAATVRRFAIRNAGTGVLNLTGVSIDGPNLADFSVGNLSATNLQVGDTAYLDVTFTPSSVNYLSAVLHITSDDLDEPSFDVALFGLGATPGASVSLVRDINRTFNGLNPTTSLVVGTQAFFLGTTIGEGGELWRTDGTAAGTYLIKDILAGAAGSTVSSLTDFNGTLFFSANNSFNGQELWKSDGTSAGTMLVKDIFPGTSSSSPANFVVVGGVFFFSATDGTNGVELWKSDGTAAGTVMVANIASGSASSSPTNLRNVNGTLFFTANDGVNGVELWKSDGSSAVLVKDIVAGAASSSPSNLFALGSILVFSVNDGTNGLELWQSDGTAVGTVILKDINAGSASSSPNNFAGMGGALYFAATTATEGVELWKTDGTVAGTVLVKDVLSGTSSSTPQNLVAVGSTLYFSAFDSTNGREPWKSDGTSAGTLLLRDVAPGSASSTPTLFVEVGGSVYFSAVSNGVADREVWKTDGTTNGTVLVKDVNPGTAASGSASFMSLGGTLIFGANDGLTGQELWKSDGTGDGTAMILEGQTGTNTASVLNLRAVNGAVFFSAADGVNGTELWKSDGTVAGTLLVKDIFPGSGSSSLSGFANIGSTLYFAASDTTTNGVELWKSDGSAVGTVLVANINPLASASSSPTSLVDFNGILFFSATDGTNGAELWKSDGTTGGTALVKNINATAAAGSSISSATVFAGALYFSASDGVNGQELWKSDGTAAGTVLLKDINAGSSSSSPANFRVVGSQLFFSASTAANGSELWVTDGSAAGTVLVSDLVAGASGSTPANFVGIGSTLYFSAFTSAAGTELWKSDGTAGGTVLVKDIVAGTSSSNPAALANINGTLYFRASTTAQGSELWKSDGTTAGTVLVSDINNGSSSSSPGAITEINGIAYMSASTAAAGNELWKSDGSVAGTALVLDLLPGAVSSTPINFVAVGNLLFFTARGPELGSSELFVLNTTPPAEIVLEQPTSNSLLDGVSTVDFGGVLTGSTGSLQFTVRNTGTLDLSGLGILIDGANAGDFAVTSSPLAPVTSGGQTTFTIQFTASVPGVRSASLHLASNDPDENPFDVSITATSLTRRESWRWQYFGSVANSGDGADANDFDFDGLPNFLEFSLKTDPTQPSQPSFVVDLVGADLEVTYTRAKAAILDGVVFTVQWVDDLMQTNWSAVGVSEVILSDDGTFQHIKATLPAGPNGRRFVRLRAVGP